MPGDVQRGAYPVPKASDFSPMARPSINGITNFPPPIHYQAALKNRFAKVFFPHDDKPEHFPVLDGLRGMALVIVLLSHSSIEGYVFHPLLQFSRIGKVGIYLFFMLSAYLLDRQIAIALMSGKSSVRYWLNYFLRRFLRIYPLFIVGLLLHLACTTMGQPTVIKNFQDVMLHLLWQKGDSIFWSIPVEFKYYFVSPLIMYFCHRVLKWQPWAILFTLLTIIMASMISEAVYGSHKLSAWSYYPTFLTGTIFSILELLSRDKIRSPKLSKWLEIGGWIGLALVLFTIPYYFRRITHLKWNFHDPEFYFPYAVIWGAVLLAGKYGTGVVKRLLELKLLRFFGAISFSVYLFHMPVVIALNNDLISIPHGLKIYVFFVVSIGLGVLGYLLVERQVAKVKLYRKVLTEKSIDENRTASQ